jgi:hypothetical protein
VPAQRLFYDENFLLEEHVKKYNEDIFPHIFNVHTEHLRENYFVMSTSYLRNICLLVTKIIMRIYFLHIFKLQTVHHRDRMLYFWTVY